MDIPSTSVIRHWCVWAADEEFIPERGHQFDAWLETQIQAERDRILAELEPLLNAPECFRLDIHAVIALVKGEKK